MAKLALLGQNLVASRLGYWNWLFHCCVQTHSVRTIRLENLLAFASVNDELISNGSRWFPGWDSSITVVLHGSGLLNQTRPIPFDFDARFFLTIDYERRMHLSVPRIRSSQHDAECHNSSMSVRNLFASPGLGVARRMGVQQGPLLTRIRRRIPTKVARLLPSSLPIHKNDFVQGKPRLSYRRHSEHGDSPPYLSTIYVDGTECWRKARG